MSLCAVTLLAASARAQTLEDYQKLRINEIIADNELVGPTNWRCRFVDMVEIYNGSDVDLDLDGPIGTVRLTDGSTDPGNPNGPPRNLSFRSHNVRLLAAGERLIVFCDENSDPSDRTEECELLRRDLDFNEVHAPFRLDNEGETLTLQLELKDGSETLETLHEVTYPPIPEDVSYARFPESLDGPEQWVFTTQPTFGECDLPVGATSSCIGESNGPGTPVRPDIELIDYATNNPTAEQAVAFRVRVRDEKIPDQSNIPSVEIRYRVDGSEQEAVPMTFVALLEDKLFPLDKWSIWEGEIPALPAGSRVDFHFVAEDADGQQDTDPGSLCDLGVGPCDAEDPTGPGPDCPEGVSCNTPFWYVVGSSYSGPLVLNEIVPNNDSIIEDASEFGCDFPNFDCRFDDFVEIYNASDAEVDLTGFVLARRAFRRDEGWVFRPGSSIGPREYLIVWLDNDDREPRDSNDPPNPNDPEAGEHHTSFPIDANSDELYLFDTAENGYAFIDGFRWGMSGRYFEEDNPLGNNPDDAAVAPLERSTLLGTLIGLDVDEGLARVPDGDRSSPAVLVPKAEVTPRESNTGDVEPKDTFRRGDGNQDGVIDVSDAVHSLTYQFIGLDPLPGCLDALDANDDGGLDVSDPIAVLGHLFLGDGPLPAPGVDSCGPDPTSEDPFTDCEFDLDTCGAQP